MSRRILLIHNEAPFAENLRHNLELDGYSVAIEHETQWAVIEARTFKPDLFIVDLSIVRSGKGRLLIQLSREHEKVPVMVMASHWEDAGLVRGFRLGLDDFVLRPVSVGDLHNRIDRLISHRDGAAAHVYPASETPLCFGSIEVNLGARTVTRNGQPVELRLKEYELLLALIAKGGRVATRRELLSEVWSYREGVSSRTLDCHIADLRRKLEETPDHPRHIITVRKVGYRFDRLPDVTTLELREEGPGQSADSGEQLAQAL